MSDNNAKRIANCFTPRIMDVNADEVEIIFDGQNTEGSNQRFSVRLSKWQLPDMIKAFAGIAKTNVSNAVEFQNRIKNAVNA